MNLNFKKIKEFVVERRIALIIILIVLIGGFFILRNGKDDGDAFTVKKADFVKTVTISGKVISSESVDLGFETGGTVMAVYKNVGDKVFRGESIAALNASELIASRDKAKADLLASQAELAKLKAGSADNTEVSNNTQEIVNSIVDAYTKSDDAVRNKIDQYFDDPRTGAPEIKYSFKDYFSTKVIINQKRVEVESILVSWQSLISDLSAQNYTPEILVKSKNNLTKIKDFIDTVSFAVNSFEISSDLTQTTVDKYRSDLYTARSNINTATSNLVSAEDKLRGSVANIPVEEAKVKSAQANVASFDAQISKTIISAPFTGVISLQDAKVGQSVGANTKITSLISDGYQVEAFIPEVNISGIALGNNAKISLDAYSGEFFEASIIHIDPAETLRDGVSNYKIKLAFLKPDKRILSGMTADVEIVTKEKKDVLLLPERVVVSELGKNYVFKKVGKESEKKEVVIGEKDGRGGIEILSGVEIGDELVLNPVTK